ncbi:hypothetical protein BGZ82_004382, partial [Podila clonocystis]
ASAVMLFGIANQKNVLLAKSRKMVKGQAALEARVQELQCGQEHGHQQLRKEHQILLQERALAAEEKYRDEEVIRRCAGRVSK